MEKYNQTDCQLSPQIVDEIRYYMAHTCLKRLKEQGRVRPEQLRRANVAIAERYGVLPYEI